MAAKLLITPYTGSVTAGQDPTIKFQGTGNSTDITLRVTSAGSLSVEGTTGQLFSVTDSMSGTIYSVNDISGIPSIEVLDTGLVKLAQYSGNVVIGSATDDGINKFQLTGPATVTGQLTSTLATGTSPLIIASTTLVTNLNADLHDGLQTATANTASTVVARDASGNFAAGTITATLIGTASGVTTNANLTGPITSTGNATAIASQTGTGSTFAMSVSPTLTTPNIGVATGTSFNSITGLSSTSPVMDSAATIGVGTTAARADHVHPSDTSKLSLSGGTMTADLILFGNTTNVLGAVTKQYTDSLTAGVDVHESVVAGTTAALPSSTYNNGASGVGATLTATANGAIGTTLGGYAIAVNDRVLVKNQAAQLQNGIYVVTSLGSAGAPWILTRSVDFDNSPANEISSGDLVYITNGTIGGTQWVETTPGVITVGTSPIAFTQFAGTGTFTAGTGIDITTNTISNTGVTSLVNGTNIAISGSTGAVTVSVTGTVPSATSAASTTNITIVDDVASATTHYPVFTGSTTGTDVTNISSTKLTWIPSTGTLGVTGAISVTGTIAATGAISGSNLSGTNTGDNAANTLYSGLVTNATHTGEVTGSVALTITNSAVTLAKMADVGTGTVFYRKTAATGAPEVQTLATLKTDLGLTGTNSGDQTIPTSLPTPNAITFNNSGTGDASGTTFNGSTAQTISYNTIGAQVAGTYITGSGSVSGTNTGDNAVNTLC
jgi:hypothetical protein